jgi:predicted NAD/FAD-binding protein
MLLDVRRFYREAPAVLHAGDHRSLRNYLEDNGYGAGLAELHLAPMCGALWSQDAESALDLPIAHVVAFMAHHQMLELRNRPAWRVVQGGSRSYVEAFERRFPGRIHTGEPVQAVRRQGGRVRVTTPNRVQWYDAVVVCTHSDQALALLDDASALERTVLGSIRYRDNVAVVHSDPAAMPTNRRAWSSWNARAGGPACSVTYWMNRLQSLSPRAENYFVTLNPEFEPQSVHAVREYAHPVFDQAAMAAQRRLDALNGCRNTYFAGAYWGWGFHEDGYQSAMTALRAYHRRQAHVA